MSEELVPTRARLQPVFDCLKPTYVDYCGNVSRRSMAASIETMTYLAYVCQRFRVRDACDLGSGYSSMVLRMFGATRADSVDDSPEWLGRTGDFLEKCGFARDGLYGWKEWVLAGRSYDLIFVDYSSGLDREMAIRHAPTRLRRGGMLICDDAQHDSHRTVMGETAVEHGLAVLPIRPLTLDEVGRYAAAMVKP